MAVDKIDLIKRNTVEIVNDKFIPEYAKKGVAYCGYECSGEIHLGHLVTIMKLLDLQNAGVKIKILLADWHTWLNKKGDWDFIKNQVKQWEKGFKAVGLKAEIIKGSSFQTRQDYVEDILKLALKITVNRGVRAMQQVARDPENAKISQIIYPLMQVVDVKELGVNFVVSGLEQRKVYMLGVDEGKEIGLQDAVYLSVPLIPSLKGKGKMSSSDKDSFISIRDSKEDIKKKIDKAYCKVGDVMNNPILSILELILFPKFGKISIKRDEKFGGSLELNEYDELEKKFEAGEIHAMDLKNSVSEYLEMLIEPMRKKWK